ncbi:molybdopterin-guanine dinucleotide biosynthesis protein B [Paenibacillus aestuarii]|uniref:Molybdopterin-guanine dinucleotide biosynthesis protein B n=1 Tax=Paenibacillus aestuarii TaxID=516965 RepID=A0ABW0KEA6_9BACL|nr:molybdopterin-guanine dinucleotide biosynthesis protein B [Paenibacillus aestuarii]
MAYCMGFAGFSDSGKTTLIVKVLEELRRRGHRVAVLKHDGHGHYKEAEGADSTAFVEAGADAVVTISPNGVHRYEKKEAPDLQEQLAELAHYDLVLIEGFKKDKHPKVAVFRTIEQSRILEELDPAPIGIITELAFESGGIPVFRPDEPQAISEFVEFCSKARQY